MGTVSRRFTDDEFARINAAVRSAESRTSAEIVPVIARSSGRYDRPEDLVGLWIGAVSLGLVWWLWPVGEATVGAWDSPGTGWELVALLAALVGGFLVGACFASRVTWLRRLFTPARQMVEEVESRAREVFFDQRVHHTAGGSGVLLYVSLFERRAAVIADGSVVDRIGQQSLDSLCTGLTSRLRTVTPIDALCATIADAGDRLATALPRATDDRNELPDALVTIE